MAFPDRLEQLMTEKGVTAYRLSKSIQCSNSTIANWKNGAVTPEGDSIRKLAEFFEVTTDYLLDIGKPAQETDTDRIIAGQSGGKATKVEETINRTDKAKNELIKEILSKRLSLQDIEQIQKIVRTFEG